MLVPSSTCTTSRHGACGRPNTKQRSTSRPKALGFDAPPTCWRTMLESMTDQGFLTARIDADGGPETRADHACVPWWSFTKTALATAALQLVGRGHFRL